MLVVVTYSSNKLEEWCEERENEINERLGAGQFCRYDKRFFVQVIRNHYNMVGNIDNTLLYYTV